MTKNELIVKQQLKIARLKSELSRMNKAADEIHVMIHCIGGPLNDNKKGYTKEQLSDWKRVAHLVDC